MIEATTGAGEAQEHSQPETVSFSPVDLDKFVALLAQWHSKQVRVLKHALTIPDTGDIAIINEVDGKEEEIRLTGDLLKGYKLGIQTALVGLGELPFKVEYEQEPSDPSSSDPAPADPVTQGEGEKGT